jgi:CDP-diacylglycerol--serine O-phosphatidyltransferase
MFMKPGQLRYLLPNGLTVLNIIAGIFSIPVALRAQSIGEFTFAAALIGVAMIGDLLDGRLARLANAESEFGGQLDSLSDAISFGVAPGLLMYAWGLESLGRLGILFAAIYAACAIMRLARFNVKASDDAGASKYFIGLPTPLAAGTVVSVVVAHGSLMTEPGTAAGWNVAALSVALGGLMVSNVRYRTFKKIDLKGRALVALTLLVALVSVIGVFVKPSVAFVATMVLYIATGIGGGVVQWGRNFLGDDDDGFQRDGFRKGEDGFVVEANDDDR